MGSLVLSVSCTYSRYIIYIDIYIPRINRCLQEFKGQWENHPLSSEGNRSPLQLHKSGMFENELPDYAGVESGFDLTMHMTTDFIP